MGAKFDFYLIQSFQHPSEIYLTFMNRFCNVLSIDFEKSKVTHIYVNSRGLSEHSTHNFSIIGIKTVITNCPPLSKMQNLHSARN